MSLRREAEGARRHRRFWAEARKVADEFGCSVDIGARIVREDDERWRRVVRGEITPAVAVREIRSDVRAREARS